MKELAITLGAIAALSEAYLPTSSKTIRCDFFPEREIIAKIPLRGMEGKKYTLYEADNGYAIYERGADDKESFAEGSYSSHSVYFHHFNEKADNDYFYYLGAGDYFIGNSAKIRDLCTQEVLNTSWVHPAERIEESNPFNAQTKSDTIKTDDALRLIANHQYFRRLSYFPMNWWSECGIVALSMYLGYLNTFNNGGFILDKIIYNSSTYPLLNTLQDTGLSSIAKFSSEQKYDQNHPTTIQEPLWQPATVSKSDWKCWDLMPGTTFAMHDYLFDKYKHTFWNIGSYDKGFPMMDEEIKLTFRDYVNANCDSTVRDHYEIASGNHWYVDERIREAINDNWPVIGVMKSYTYANASLPKSSNKDNKYHDVIMYGHQGENFLCHFGWDPNSLRYSSVMVHHPNNYGYFYVRYKGQHVHSKAARNKALNHWVCSCGEILGTL